MTRYILEMIAAFPFAVYIVHYSFQFSFIFIASIATQVVSWCFSESQSLVPEHMGGWVQIKSANRRKILKKSTKSQRGGLYFRKRRKSFSIRDCDWKKMLKLIKDKGCSGAWLGLIMLTLHTMENIVDNTVLLWTTRWSVNSVVSFELWGNPGSHSFNN